MQSDTRFLEAAILLLAFSSLTAWPARGSEEIVLSDAPAAPCNRTFRLSFSATSLAGAIQGYVLSVRRPPGVVFTDFVPAGPWIEDHPPDLVFSTGTLARPADSPGAGLAVVLDAADDGIQKAIPPAPDGSLTQIALLSAQVELDSAFPIPIKIEDQAAAFSGGVGMANSLIIGGQDYSPMIPTHSLVLREGAVFLVPGDTNGDGLRDISDAVYLLNNLFLGGPPPCCPKLALINNDALVDISDTIYLLNFLFLGGPPPQTVVGCL